MALQAYLNQSCFPGISVAHFLEVAAVAGCDGADLNVLMQPVRPRDISAAVQATGMRISAIHALMDWALPDDPEPLATMEPLLEAAIAANASYIVCVAPLRLGGFPPDLDIWAAASDRLRELAARARPAGVRLALEQVGRSSSRRGAVSGIRRVADALSIAERAGEDIVLAVDSYNLATADEPFDVLRAVPAHRLGVAHLADLEPAEGGRTLAGRGTLDLPVFVRALTQAGYGGPLSLEIFPATSWQDPLAFAREAVAAMRRCIAEGSAGERE
jgi:4-hydroxyphenylpyruvate dioxygenase